MHTRGTRARERSLCIIIHYNDTTKPLKSKEEILFFYIKFIPLFQIRDKMAAFYMMRSGRSGICAAARKKFRSCGSPHDLKGSVITVIVIAVIVLVVTVVISVVVIIAVVAVLTVLVFFDRANNKEYCHAKYYK